MYKRLLILLTFSTLLSACGGENFSWDASSNPASTISDSTSNLSMCSALELSEISWPQDFSSTEQVMMSVAMNVTGSFEGDEGWSNLSNNFDGQGLSMGLFNQNLGSGSLQPLLNKMKSNAVSQMQSVLVSKNLNSLSTMINNWKQNGSISQTISWAVINLYVGGSFKSDWSNQLRALAKTPYYRSLQVEAAAYYHRRAMDYVDLFGTSQLRSYLFFFDIVIQNGGVPTAAVNSLIQKFNKTLYTEEQKLNAVLTALLPYVNSAYREDVRRRKSSIINQVGVVHGSQRQYNREYCTDLLATI